MGRLHRSRQRGLSMGLLVNWKSRTIYRSLIESQMTRRWGFVVKEAQRRSTNRSKSETP